MIEIFLKNNWRSVILLVTVLLAWFVWPTPYYYFNDKELGKGLDIYRQNRFTGRQEAYWGGLGQWRYNDVKSFRQAGQELDELRKKTMGEGDSKE